MCYAQENIKDNLKKKAFFLQEESQERALLFKNWFLKVAAKSRVVKTNPKSTHLKENKAQFQEVTVLLGISL